MRRFFLLGVLCLSAPSAQAQDFDFLIHDCRIVDGTGNPWYRADVGIRDGRIAAIGRLEGHNAARTIDAQDRVLTPGFIDVHTHVERGIQRNPGADNFLRDGVTTVVTGNCGASQIDLGAWFQQLEDQGLGINLASLIGHNSVRRQVMGNADRKASAEEIQAMQQLVEKAMQDGAVGFSTGLLYIPGTYADTEEVVALAQVAARFGGVYASHIRNQGARLHDSIQEAAQIGRRAGLPVQISHLKVKGKKRWGSIGTTLRMLDQLRQGGLEIAVDAYPYPRASTNLGVNLPSWALADGAQAVHQRLEDPPTRARILAGMKELIEELGFDDYSFATVAGFRADPSLEGKTISQINRLRGRQASLENEMETILEMIAQGGASMIYHYMSDEDVEAIFRFSHTAVASDGGIQTPGRGKPHPRSYGTNARVLSELVRERSLLSLEEAVRRMTSLPAQLFRLQERGLLRQGMVADLVLFDPAQVRDQATFEDPHQFSLGFDYVWVGGRLAVEGGALKQARAGTVLIQR